MNAKVAVLAKEMKGKRKRDEGTSSNRDKKKELRSVRQAIGEKKQLPASRQETQVHQLHSSNNAN